MRCSLPAVAVLLLAGAWLNVAAGERLPQAFVVAALLGALLLIRVAPALSVVVAGVALVWVAAGQRLGDRLPAALEGRDIEADVQVLDFPEPGPVLRLVVAPVAPGRLPGRMRLSWYDDARPAAGECWRLTMRLRQPRGFSNPGRFDYEAWLFAHGFGATGYVRAALRRPQCDVQSPLLAVRSGLAARIRGHLPDDDATAILLAVVLGARQWIDNDRWQQFAVTGTSHLMAISGMHVALASGAVFVLVRLLLGCLGLRGNQGLAAAVAAAGFAVAYACLSGFAVPSRRAVLMLALALLALLARRAVSPWQVLAATACAVVLLTPLDVLGTGFRLSFSAVALLLVAAVRRAPPAARDRGMLQRAGSAAATLAALQAFLVVAMVPLTVVLFGRLAWTAVPVNMLAIPLFNFVALPAALAGTVLPTWPGDVLLTGAWHATRVLLALIETAANVPHAGLRAAGMTGPGWVAVALIAACACLPAAWPGRRLALLAAPLLVFPARPAPPVNCLDVDVLDVGQGLSAVLRTRTRTLVYDAGPSFRSGGDTGRLVVVPFLDYHGVRRVDRLIVSHGDNDHAGGVASVLAEITVASILSGEPLAGLGGGPRDARPCERGMAWTWDGVGFRVLHPAAGSRHGNDASCVLEVRAGDRRLLLTGDIEAGSERQLVAENLLAPVDIALIPHHGSKTSSHPAFVKLLRPAVAIASAGHRNRWNMPLPEIVERWSATGAEVLTTADSGAIGLRLCAGSVAVRYRHRSDARRFWTAQ